MDEATQTGSGWASARVFAAGLRVGDRYIIKRFLAAGGMGEVYLATDSTLGEDVALKVLKAGSTTRLEDEVRLARKVTHLNVCRVFDLGVHHDPAGDRPFVTMEFVEGQTLSARLRERGALPARELEHVVDGLADALTAAHAVGITHGDLKPGNVMLTPGGRVVVTDFGLASPSGVSATSSAGTPAFLSPEQVSGLPGTTASDVYALGVLVFQLASGALPFSGNTTAELVRARLEGAVDLARVPASLRAFITACLQVDPAARPQASSLRTLRGSTSPRWRVASVVAVLALSLVAGLVWLNRARASFEPRPVRVAVHASGADARWLEDATAALLSRGLERTRWFRVDPSATTALELTLEGDTEHVQLTLRGPGVERQTSAASVSGAVASLVPFVVESLATTGEASASSTEQAEMARVGVKSVSAWRAFQDSEEFWSIINCDSESIAASLRRALADEPGWARLWVRLIIAEGHAGSRARATLLEAQKAVERGRDPVGDELLRLIGLIQSNDNTAVIERTRALATKGDGALEASWLLNVALYRSDRFEEMNAVNEQLFEAQPEQQWGGNVVFEMQLVGRRAQIPEVMSRWATRAPGSQQQVITQVSVAAMVDPPSVSLHAERLFRMYGKNPGNIVSVTESLVTAERFTEARALAREMVGGDPLQSHRAHFFYGVMSMTEGRLTEARESFLSALELGRPFGLEAYTSQTLFALARIDEIAGHAEGTLTHLDDLSRTVETNGFPTISAGVRLELGFLKAQQEGKPRDCSSVEQALKGTPTNASEAAARRYAVRVGGKFGCSDCASVLREGTGFIEPSTEWLVGYGRCAVDAGELALARRALERAVEVFPGSRLVIQSPFDMVLARYELGRLAEKEGKPLEALAHYQKLLHFWDGSEVKTPELEAARLAVQRLAPPTP